MRKDERKSMRGIFQTNLKYYRKKKNLTQEELAVKASVHRTYISEMESGKCCPSLEIVGRIADAFHLPGWRLLFPSNEEELQPLIEHKIIDK